MSSSQNLLGVRLAAGRGERDLRFSPEPGRWGAPALLGNTAQKALRTELQKHPHWATITRPSLMAGSLF